MIRNLPITVPFEEDELLYSWVFRLYKTNLFNSRRDFEKSVLKSQAMHPDGFSFSRSLLLSTSYNKDQYSVFLKHTLFPFYSIFYNKEKIEKVLCLQRLGFKKNSPLSSLKDEIKDLKYCPECLKEKGGYYLQRAHQLPDVKVCHKHKCRLKSLDKFYNGEEISRITDLHTDFSVLKDEYEYSVFMKAILDQNYDMNLNDLSRMISKRIQDIKLLNQDDVLKFFKDQDADITNNQATTLLRDPKNLSCEFLQRNLKTIFENFLTFNFYYKKFVAKKTSNFTLIKRLKNEGYNLISPYRKNILEFSHIDCGGSFLISEFGLKAGLRCPSCQRLKSEDFYKLLFDAQSKGEFKMLTPYKDNSTKILIKHSCGHEFEAKPNRFYFDNMGCPKCLSKNTLEVAQEKVDEIDPNWQVLEYDSLDSKAKFLHTECGHKIERRFSDFLRKGMSCPYCKEDKRKSYLLDFNELVYDLVGDEYEVVSEFDGNRRPIRIRHNECGLVKEYKRADDFLKGMRCPICNLKLSDDAVSEYVKARTKDFYEVSSFFNKKVELLIPSTGEKIIIERKILLQELAKPNESKILPCVKDLDVKRPLSNPGKALSQLKVYFTNKPFNSKDLTKLGFETHNASSAIRLLSKEGLIVKAGPKYRLSDALPKD